MITEKEKQEVEDIVKKLIFEKVSLKLTDTDIKARGISKFDVAQSFLTDIMALGYNNYKKELAVNDILELQSQMPWTQANKSDILNRINLSEIKFKTEIDGFIDMIKNISSGYDKQTILDNVKKTLG